MFTGSWWLSAGTTTKNLVAMQGMFMTSLNAGLQELATKMTADLMTIEPAMFVLRDGTIDDGYLLPDGVHWIGRAQKRLAKNICPVNKNNTNDITKTSQQACHNHRQSPSNRQDDHKPAAPPHSPAAAPSTATYMPPPRSGDRQSHWSALPPDSRYTDGYACYFCGETNHNRYTCWWGRPVTCFCCRRKAHNKSFVPSLHNNPRSHRNLATMLVPQWRLAVPLATHIKHVNEQLQNAQNWIYPMITLGK